ncbi:hypothetical protein DNX69_10705 [Rhodopseudomonas palustris]|uniref:Chromosomal replication initiator DnaA C-terminal domain-containing protein n=1 Tax=Rhodopseudomonas palustris TaxID=1076 RepID=A0A323UJ46_RHOPL|nr:helix-turn-helix domain-containing protein [Rhodopseudomonas palustris]PZA12439.1 hypothetical protein DNX69_10705 [Rhodopseudomonas palustris]
MSAPVAQRFVSVRLIIFAVAEAFGVSITELRSSRRTAATFRARAAACLLGRELTRASFPMVGRMLGDRDHSTIMKAVLRAEGMLRTDEDFAVRYAAAKRAIQIIANSKLAELIRDDDTAAVAARICEHPSQADRVSTLQIIAMAARLVTLEELAEDAFNMLASLDQMVDQPDRAALLRRDLHTRINAITESLGSLGYVTEPQGEAHV